MKITVESDANGYVFDTNLTMATLVEVTQERGLDLIIAHKPIATYNLFNSDEAQQFAQEVIMAEAALDNTGNIPAEEAWKDFLDTATEFSRIDM